jgi:hypothetical protein
MTAVGQIVQNEARSDVGNMNTVEAVIDIEIINLASLAPEKLFIINVEVGGIKMKALVDSGASNNLIKYDKANELGLSTDTREQIVIKGLGKSEFRTIGKLTTGISICGVEIGINGFGIAPLNTIGVDIILGVSFFKKNKFIIDVGKRKLEKKGNDGSTQKFYFDVEGTVIRVIQEGIPVLLAKTVEINDDICKVPVKMNVKSINDCDNWYFEGKVRQKKFRGIDGIVGVNNGNFVLLAREDSHDKTDNECKTRETVKLKKGLKLGEVSTIVEIEDDEIELEDKAIWTERDIGSKLDIGDEISEGQNRKACEMLVRVQNVFGKSKSEFSQANVIPHTIELTDNTPIWQNPRRFSEPITNEIEKQCDELIDLDVIEHSNSPFSSPIVPVRKKNGQLRMCIDYRKINSVTKTEKYPMPTVADSIYSVQNVQYFSKLDLVKGYYQIPLDSDSRQYTAFSTPHNHYQFKRLAFGLKNSGIYFQRAMQEILADFKFHNVIVFIDDILIMSESFEKHLELTEQVLTTLKNNGITVNVSKCEFFKNEVGFLGHVLSREGIRKSEEYMDKVKHYPKPETVTQLRQFLGLVNFQGKFVDNLSTICKPLNEKTGGSKKKKLEWDENMDRAFETLKDKLTKEVLLSFPEYRKGAAPLELSVDASGVGVGGCLQQLQKGIYRTIGFAAMTFSKAQCNYSTIERELCAIRWGVKIFRPFLFGVKFIIHTDHKPLIYLQNLSQDNSKLMRTITELAEYDFNIKYKPGKDNGAADALSRIVGNTVGDSDNYDDISYDLPSEFTVLEVKGGGDSLFESLLCTLNKKRIRCAEDKFQLRIDMVTHLIANHNTYKVEISKGYKKQLEAMKRPGQLPCEALLLVACDLYGIEIWVHHGMPSPVIYRSNRAIGVADGHLVHLQCISGIHFNGILTQDSKTELHYMIRTKNINGAVDEILENRQDSEPGSDDEELDKFGVNLHQGAKKCEHDLIKDVGCIVEVYGSNYCALVDTGAQVSLISENAWDMLKVDQGHLVLEDASGNILTGIDQGVTEVLGIVRLDLKILGVELQSEVPMAVVTGDCLPSCFLLGANFLTKHNIVVDYCKNILGIRDSNKLVFPFGVLEPFNFHHNRHVGFIGQVICVDDDNEDRDRKVRYDFADNMVILQDRDHAVRMLKNKIRDNVPVANWLMPCLKKFSRYVDELGTESGLLVRCKNSRKIVVVSFPMLIEIVHKTHQQVAHIGRHKLVSLVSEHFWHPSLDEVCRDVCSSCIHCQLYKVSSQPVAPPTIKIQSSCPYDLVAMDLIQFPISARGHVAALVIVDHNSKQSIAIPLRNKRSDTVANALLDRGLPAMLRIPNRILTDNGPEFRGGHFEQLLEEHNIEHVYSTRYRAEGNGAVERCNRTIT